MDYEKKWNELREVVNEMVDYYKRGVMCSMAESCWGESICKDVLHEMDRIEEGK